MTSYLYQFTINLYSITGTTFRLLVNNFTALLDVEFYYFTTRGMLSILMIVSISLCICISKQPHVQTLWYFLHKLQCHLTWSSDDSAISYVLWFCGCCHFFTLWAIVCTKQQYLERNKCVHSVQDCWLTERGTSRCQTRDPRVPSPVSQPLHQQGPDSV